MSAYTSRQLTNYATNSDYDDHGGMFVMRHRANSMSASTSTNASNPEDLRFVDSGASNHMISHQEWFHDLREPYRSGYVGTRDDTIHPIRHVGNAPFRKKGEQTCIKKRITCSHHNKEFGLYRPNYGVRDASSIQPRWLLHRE